MRGDESQFDLELPQVSKLSNRFILSNSRISKTLVIFLFLQIFQFFTPGNLQVLSAAVSSAPTISSATGENGYALITFSAATGATNYDYSIDGGISWTTRSPASTWTTLAIPNLTNGTAYSIKIRGRDGTSVGAASNAVSVTPNTRSQILSSQGFLQGKYVEVGVRNNGAFGSSTTPTGFHGNVSNCLGFRVDRQKNGWGSTSGSLPNFTNIDDGDYFCPGSPYEGWSLKVGSNSTAFNSHARTAINGTISNLVTNSSEQKVDWNSTSSYNGISISQTSVVPNEGQSLHVDVTLRNTTGSALTDIYYGRGFDPDNSTGSSTGAITTTSINAVTSRGGSGSSAEVKATFDSGAQVLLRSTDSNARASAYSGDCCTDTIADPVSIWNASGNWSSASVGPGDNQVAVAIKVATLAAGASVSFRISYVLTAEEANSPSATTVAASNVDTTTTATLNSSVNPNGAATTVEFEYGTTPLLDAGVSLITAGALSGSTSQSTSANVSGLTLGVTYYFRVKATNSVGISYGGILSFTPIGPPVITIGAATAISETTTTLNAQINAMGGTTSSLNFVYSSDSNFAADTFTVTATPNSVSGNSITSVTANLSGLTGAVTYYFRVVAINIAGTTTSSSSNFTTTPAPSATTSAATLVTASGATLNGTVNARGVATTSLYFIYSTSATFNSDTFTVNTTPSSSNTNANVSVSANITGLSVGVTYYFKLYVANINGSNSGAVLSFTPSAAPTVTTDSATVSGVTATLKGSVVANGSTTTSVSFTYSTNPSLSSDTATVSVSPSAFSGSSVNAVSTLLSGLTPLTTYYYRLVATNGIGSSSGQIISFVTPNADVTSPSVVLTSNRSVYAKTESILVTITYSESITGFTSSDLTLSGTSSSGWSKGTPNELSPTVYTVLLTPSAASTGTLLVNFPSGGVIDYSSNSNTAASTLTLSIREPQSNLVLTSTSGVFLTLLKLTYSGGSGSGSISFSTSNGTASGCSVVNGDSLTASNAGTCLVTVTKEADATYAQASDTRTVTFSKALRTIQLELVDSSTSLTFGQSKRIFATISLGSDQGTTTFSAGASSACNVVGESVTATSGTGSCVLTATVTAGSDYESATSTYLVITVLKAHQTTLSIGQYNAFVGVSSYPINVYGGSTNGSVSRSLIDPGTAFCSLTSGMFLSALQVGSCTVQAVKAGDTNYLSETATATIYWIQWSDAYATRAPSTPTEIVLNHETAITKYNYETLTVTSYQNSSGVTITSISTGATLRIIGDGFSPTAAYTQVTFKGGRTILDLLSGVQVLTDGSGNNYLQLTVPSGVSTGSIVVNSPKGRAEGPTLTILSP